MKCNLFILIFCLFTAIAFSQKKAIIVTYNYSNDYYSNKEFLYASNANAVYVKPSINKNFENEIIEDGNNNFTLPLSQIKTASISHFMNVSSDAILSYTVDLEFNRFLVDDKTFSIKWKVEPNENKKIAGYDCFKATTSFRGRKYIAFFTDKIPVRFGPFKFKGLPGLILEIYNTDTDIKHSWQATSIKTIDNYDHITFLPDPEKLDGKKVTLKEFMEMDKKLNEEKDKRFNARQPSGVKVVSSKRINLGIEKTYEWESEN